ncbi:MAG: 50S ribosomal protein L30 [Chitinispirillales bacterium]|jgi:large subunit ribosomal protein L30|nr:50S ribosomal protein L30 [Chitinispirillales bacterium]
MAKLKITQVRSTIGRNFKQGRTIEALGLKRLHDSVVKDDKPEIRGMLNKVVHLVKVEEVKG